MRSASCEPHEDVLSAPILNSCFCKFSLRLALVNNILRPREHPDPHSRRFQPDSVAMADVFLMPPSTAELARENAPPRCSPYDKVKVLLSGWECDEKNHRGKNLDKMGALLKFWGYDVTRIFGDSTDGKAPRRHETGAYPTPVARAGSAASPCAVTDGFKKRLEGDFVPPAGPQEKRRTLLIVCYFGHGTKKRPGLKNGKKWLYGAR